MKKINKIVAGLMVLGMGTGVAGALPLQSFKTVSAQETADFSVAGFKTELKIGEDVTLPAESTGVTRTVIDPMGNVVTLTDNKLEALKLGTYTVRYVKDIQNSDGKIVQEYKVNVTGDKPQITFESNNERIIPETVNLGKTVVLPVPTAMVNGEEVAEAERANISVTVTKPDHTTASYSYADLLDDTKNKVEISANGLYTITYKYVKGNNANNALAYKTFTVNAKSTYKPENILLTHTLNSTMPTSINLGSEVTLPSVTVKDENNSNATVKAYYKITVVNVDNNKTYTVDKDNKFVPMDKGQYRVTYEIKDFFGSKLKGTTDNKFTYTIDKCTDTIAPTPMVVENYAQTAVDGAENTVKVSVDSLVNAEAKVVSKYYLASEGASVNVKVPAIFATDAYEVQKVEDGAYYQFNKNNITLTRRIVDSNGTTVKSWSSADENAFEEKTFAISKSGSYKIEYTARDSAGNSKTTTYAFEVVKEGFQDAVKPTIEYDDLQLSYAFAGQKISFKKPTVTDKAQNDAVGDTRVETKTYYYYNNDSANKAEVEEDEDNAENFAFTLPEDVTGKNSVTILTTATDDAGNTESKEYTINIIGGAADAVLPTINGALTLSGETAGDINSDGTIDQRKTVKISDITLSDNNDFLGAQMAVRYFKNSNDTVGTEVSLETLTTVYDKANSTVTLKDASFIATNVGTYVVTVIGQDLSGNTTIKAATIKTKDVVAPEIFVNWNYTSVELGENIILPQVQVYDNNELLPNAEVVIEVSGPSYVLNGYQFTPLAKGNYTVKYKSQDASGNPVESQTYTIYAEDTVKPEIIINEVFPATAPYVANQAVRIPGFAPTDNNGINWEETKVEVTKNDTPYELTEIENGNAYTFLPSGNGSYTVKYTAVDKTGLETIVEKTIKVGDVTAPTISFADNDTVNKPGSKKVGDKLQLDLTKVIIRDAEDAELNGTNGVTFADALENDDISAQVYVRDADGNIVEKETDEDYYLLKKQGTYKIEYRVTDCNGNIEVETHTFSVNAKTTKPKITTEALGIILIVASLLLLGGVIAYFFATRKVVRKPKKD